MSKKHSVRHTGMCFMIAITMLSVEGMRAQHLDTDSITGRVHDIPMLWSMRVSCQIR